MAFKQQKGKRPSHLSARQDATDPIRAKKHLGQHFLNDMGIAEQITTTLTGHGGYKTLLEVGPGTGVLTQFLANWANEPDKQFWLVDVDKESVAYLHKNYPELATTTLHDDFLKWDLSKKFQSPIGIIGNFPYNISSQIFFKVLDHVDLVPEVVGMLQKEVAERLASPPGNKDYGILSVLLQVWYDIEYCFTVPEHVFSPPPKVKSGVIRLKRNSRTSLPCSASLFKQVVKQGFNNRRKTLRNALRGLTLASGDRNVDTATALDHPDVVRYLDKRAEQLGVEDFITMTLAIEQALK